MEIVRGLVNARPADRGCALTIGNFDGVHLGHLEILRRLREGARPQGLPVTVVTFEPHPRERLAPDQAPPRLMRVRDKAQRLAEAGVDRLVVLRFDERLQGWSAEAFAEALLVQGLGARHVAIGEGFRFGRGRHGTVETLRSIGGRCGFSVEEVPPVALAGERISSTRVRQALEAGRLDEVSSLLGRDFRVTGRVISGQRLGRQLGFPTANLRLHRRRSPVRGIFAVRVQAEGGEPVPGVASVGTRPTVGGTEVLLEAHLFDWQGDLYGRYLAVDFVARLRDELRFDNLEQMVERMHVDAREARAVLGLAP